MTQWTGASRSNYVKCNAEKLETLKQIFEFDTREKDGKIAIISIAEGGETPYIDPDYDAEFLDILADMGAVLPEGADSIWLVDVIHLALEKCDDNVLVWIEAGCNGESYVGGYSVAIDPDGRELRKVNLADIYAGTKWGAAEF